MGFCTCHWLSPYPTTQIASPEYPVFLWTVGTTLSLKLELWSYPSSYLLHSGSYWQTVIIPGCQMYFLTLSVVSPSSGSCLLTALLCWCNWSMSILLPPTISHLGPLKTDLTIHSVDLHDNQIGLPIIFHRAFKSLLATWAALPISYVPTFIIAFCWLLLWVSSTPLHC